MLATTALVVANAVVSIDATVLDVTAAGGATATVAEVLVLAALVDVEEDEELELELVLVLVELELVLESPALTARASVEMAEWHCAVMKIHPSWSEKTSGDVSVGFGA